MKQIGLAHGNGGKENNSLITKLFFEKFNNKTLLKAEDAAVIQNGTTAFTTDSFTINPIFFSGGDIGKLSICGTCNDLAMLGARPDYLTCAFILEEGFSYEKLEKIVISMQKELEINGAKIVSGDTKVVPKGSVDKIFINTTGVGEILQHGISSNKIKEDDLIIVSGSIGRHGAAVYSNREGIELTSGLKSDCASLWPVVNQLIKNDINITALRDATRGGLAAVLNEWTVQSNVCIEIEEPNVPICNEVQGVCELLGFDAFYLANEGTFVIAVNDKYAKRTIDILKKDPFCSEAVIIGKVTNQYPKKVVVKSGWGTSRFLETPTGELLPRIC